MSPFQWMVGHKKTGKWIGAIFPRKDALNVWKDIKRWFTGLRFLPCSIPMPYWAQKYNKRQTGQNEVCLPPCVVTGEGCRNKKENFSSFGAIFVQIYFAIWKIQTHTWNPSWRVMASFAWAVWGEAGDKWANASTQGGNHTSPLCRPHFQENYISQFLTERKRSDFFAAW